MRSPLADLPFARRLERVIHGLAFWLAMLGGVSLLLVVAVTLTSIAGRLLVPLGLAPIAGDFELVEAGTAFAVFAFLPWCQLRRGHVAVDLIVARLGPRALACSEFAGALAMALAVGLLTWRLALGLGDRLASGETSYILGLPLWLPYAAALAALGVLVVTSLWCLWRGLAALARGGAAP